MKQAYSVVNSRIIVTNLDQKKASAHLFFRMVKILSHLLIALSVFFITIYTFYLCLRQQGDALNTISLGAVFATLASTIVSIASLLCGKSYEDFVICIETLRTELLSRDINLKWNFIKKSGIIKKSKQEYITYQITNPKLHFEIGTVNLSIEIPAHKKDFYELDILRGILKMKATKKIYISYILSNSDSIMEPGVYVWECVYKLLCRAFAYKCHRSAIILGVEFFISGLICTMGYPLIQAYF